MFCAPSRLLSCAFGTRVVFPSMCIKSHSSLTSQDSGLLRDRTIVSKSYGHLLSSRDYDSYNLFYVFCCVVSQNALYLGIGSLASLASEASD